MLRTMNPNINKKERIASVVVGAILLGDGLLRKRKKFIQMIAGSILIYRGLSGNSPVYRALDIDTTYKKSLSPLNIRVSAIVNRPRAEVYNYWRHLENMPLFMSHVSGVEVLNPINSRWFISLPGNIGTLQYDTAIVHEEEGHMIGWKSLPGAPVEHVGKVTFEDAGPDSTMIDILFSYQAPGGKIGKGIAQLFTPVFQKQVRKDLENFKWHIERGQYV